MHDAKMARLEESLALQTQESARNYAGFDIRNLIKRFKFGYYEFLARRILPPRIFIERGIMTKKIIGIGAMALAAMPAFATDLWDQQATFHSSGGSGFVNQNFTDFPTYSTYDVSDVIVGAGGWNVTSVSVEVIASSTTGILTMTQGLLNVFSNSGSLPGAGNNPASGTAVAITVTPDSNFSNVFYITASGLNLNLSAGE